MAHSANHCDVLDCPACRDGDRLDDQQAIAERALTDAIKEYEATNGAAAVAYCVEQDEGRLRCSVTLEIDLRADSAEELGDELAVALSGNHLVGCYAKLNARQIERERRHAGAA